MIWPKSLSHVCCETSLVEKIPMFQIHVSNEKGRELD
jgi:hypothetical protein